MAHGQADAQTADCPESSGGVAVTCPDTTRQILQHRLNRTVATDPGAHALQRLNGASPGQSAPFSLTPAPDHASFATSLHQWGAYLSQSELRRFEEAKALGPSNLTLPKPPPNDGSGLDIWARARVDAGEHKPKDRLAHTNYLGADYMLGRRLVFGGMVQFDGAQTDLADFDGTAVGQGYMAGPYTALRLSPNLVLDTQLAWGHAQDQFALSEEMGVLNTDRRMARTRLEGSWNWGQWRFSPSAAVNVMEEDAAVDAADGDAPSAGLRNVTVGPRIARPYSAGEGRTIEPFVQLRSSMDLDTAGALLHGQTDPDVAGAHNTLGGGFAISKPESYTLRATTELEGVGSEAEGVRSRLQVTVPLGRTK